MAFWESLTLLQKIYFCVGIGATVFLILQIVTLLFGIGGEGEVDVDLSGDGEVDATVDVSDGFTLFSVRGIVAFFAIGSWVGYAISYYSTALSIVLALLSGLAALFAMAVVMRSVMKLRSSGNIEISRAIGKNATVYLTIPAKGLGHGKINLTLEERFVELEAITTAEKSIPTGAQVKIVGVQGDRLIVEKL